jgi:hypothetical protein
MLRLAHRATRDQLAREGVRPAFFTGGEGQKRRTQNIVDYYPVAFLLDQRQAAME